MGNDDDDGDDGDDGGDGDGDGDVDGEGCANTKMVVRCQICQLLPLSHWQWVDARLGDGYFGGQHNPFSNQQWVANTIEVDSSYWV